MSENLLPGLNITASEYNAIIQRVGRAVEPLRNDDYSWVKDYLPRSLPDGWVIHQWHPIGGLKATHYAGLKVIMTGSREDDGKRWIHLSCSRQKRIPNWDDLKLVKEFFLGPDRWAIQVLPTRDKYVNINSFVLHLWHCADEYALPDFTMGTGSI